MGSITPNSIGFEKVGPEKLDLYEVGAKTSFHGTVSGYLNVAGFYNDFRDQQISFNPTIRDEFQGVLTNASPNVNAGHSRIWGVEVDASATFFRQLKVDVGYSYLNSKVLSAIDVATLLANTPYYDPARSFLTANTGDPLGLTPKNTVTVTGTYMLPVDESLGRISFGATYTHIDANQAEEPQADPLYLIKAEDQVNLNFDWRGILGKPVDLSVFVTNLTNQGRVLYPNNSYNVIGIAGGHVNQPRMWGARLRYNFGS
jgi:iron complex outermembrane receptor protein